MNTVRAENRKTKTMVTLENLRTEKRDAILRFAERHGCRNVRVFGSVAAGNSSPDSDVDFLVDLDQDRNLFDLAGFVADLEDLLGVKVDVVTSRSLRYIKDSVLAEAQPL